MKRLVIPLTLLLVVVPAASAQDETTFTWAPYDFTVTLPDGWVAAGAGGRLVLGRPGDVNAVVAGEVAEGTVVVLRVVEPPEVFDGNPYETIASYAPHHRPESSTRQFGGAEWPVVDIPPFGGRQGMLVRVADTFLVTASAPVDVWADAVPVIDELVASMGATPVSLFGAERLTQQIVWRELSFMTPAHWVLAYAAQDNIYVLTTHFNRLQHSRTFRVHNLMVIIRDYSAVRHMLTPESIPILRTYLYVPEDYVFGLAGTVDVEGFTATSVDFIDIEGDTAGTAMLLLTPESAYLFAGMAGSEQWIYSEQALFEAIVATLARHD